MNAKARQGPLFDDFEIGQTFDHAGARTLTEGDNALYLALTGDRAALFSNAPLARRLGYRRELIHDLLVFHVVFGRSVPDVSVNATANLGYADVRFMRPAHPGDTLTAISRVMGKKANRDGASGIVYVRTQGFNQNGDEVVRFFRWVMIPRAGKSAKPGERVIPNLPAEATIEPAAFPADANVVAAFTQATGGRFFLEDYEPGERIEHPGGVTIEDAEHQMAARLYQNTARVHMDAHWRGRDEGGRRVVYGGHVISVARALAFNGLENAARTLAWNGATHANPAHGGDTIYAFSEALGTQSLPGRKHWGALRLRTIALKNHDPSEEPIAIKVQTDKTKPARYHPAVVLDMDYVVLMPKRG